MCIVFRFSLYFCIVRLNAFFVVLRLCLVFLVLNSFVFISFKVVHWSLGGGAKDPWGWDLCTIFPGFFILL